MDNPVILIPMPQADFFSKMQEIIKAEFDARYAAESDAKVLSPDQVCKHFGVSKPTLTSWTNGGHIPVKRIGRRLFYKQSDVFDAGKRLKKYMHNV